MTAAQQQHHTASHSDTPVQPSNQDNAFKAAEALTSHIKPLLDYLHQEMQRLEGAQKAISHDMGAVDIPPQAFKDIRDTFSLVPSYNAKLAVIQTTLTATLPSRINQLSTRARNLEASKHRQLRLLREKRALDKKADLKLKATIATAAASTPIAPLATAGSPSSTSVPSTDSSSLSSTAVRKVVRKTAPKSKKVARIAEIGPARPSTPKDI